jgi:hypothetical protein
MALFKYRDQVGIGDVLFGEPGDAAVIGWLTLASLGFELDPATGQLMPLPMLLV